MIEAILEIAKKYQIPPQFEIISQELDRLVKKIGSPTIQNLTHSQKVVVKLPFQVPKEKVIGLKKEAEQKLSCPVVAQQTIGVGAIFPDYGELANVLSEGTTRLAHQEGQVLFVDVWATWCGPCQRPMQHNEQLLQKYGEVWGNRVRIVGVSVDEQVGHVVARVNQKNWKRVIHLCLGGWKGDHPLIQNFDINGIPFSCLVDTHGKIVYTGHPSHFKLEEKINQLLKQEKSEQPQPLNKSKQQNRGAVWSVEQLQKWRNLTSVQLLEQKFGKLETFHLRYGIQRNYKDGVITNEAHLEGSVWKRDQNLYLEYKEEFKDIPSIIFEQNFLEYEQIPQVSNPNCWKCNEALTYPYYWLKWEEQNNKFACRSCIQSTPSVPGKHYIYEKNSILLQGKWNLLEKKITGSNIQPDNLQQEDLNHQFECNFCGKSPEVIEARYVCLPCGRSSQGYFDVCQSCMNQLLAGKKQQVDSHKSDHPFLRILYSVKGYYEF